MAGQSNKINTALNVNINLPTGDETGDDAPKLENLSVTPVAEKEKLVEVYITANFRPYIGNQWWDFKVGKAFVPQYIKDHLNKVGVLKAI